MAKNIHVHIHTKDGDPVLAKQLADLWAKIDLLEAPRTSNPSVNSHMTKMVGLLNQAKTEIRAARDEVK